jgi:hypothetical protein
MCDLGIVLAIGSTVLGAAGQVQAGKAQAQADNYNAQVSTMNAELENRKAKDAIERGAKEEQQKRLQTSMLIGKQRAAMAANGVDLSFGSPLDTLVDTAKMGEIDALNIRTNSYREAYEHQTQESNYKSEAAMNRAKAKSDAKAGYIGAMGTILGGGGKAYSSAHSLGYIG